MLLKIALCSGLKIVSLFRGITIFETYCSNSVTIWASDTKAFFPQKVCCIGPGQGCETFFNLAFQEM